MRTMQESTDVDTMTGQNTGGYIGVNKTAEKISSRYYWPNITGDVRQFCKTCHTCQMKKELAIAKTSTELHPISIPTKVMSQVGVDLMHMKKANKGYHYIISSVDYFSKYCELGALRNKEAVTVGKWIYDNIFCR